MHTPVTCPECGAQVTHLRRHLKKVHPESPQAAPAPARKRAPRPAKEASGELWAKCPECRTPVRDAELFQHLLNCPGAEARQAEWAAQQAAAAVEAARAAEALKAAEAAQATAAAKATEAAEVVELIEAAGVADARPEAETAQVVDMAASDVSS